MRLSKALKIIYQGEYAWDFYKDAGSKTTPPRTVDWSYPYVQDSSQIHSPWPGDKVAYGIGLP
jgi:hypothetical protein